MKYTKFDLLQQHLYIEFNYINELHKIIFKQLKELSKDTNNTSKENK